MHDIFHLRLAVFVVEQKCAFQDVDGADPASHHLYARNPRGEIAAYCRLVPPGVKFPEPSIGRVITMKAERGSGLGRQLMARALEHAQRLWPGRPIRIGAQQYLERFYGSFGFVKSSDPYDEDGIQHIEMVRDAPR